MIEPNNDQSLPFHVMVEKVGGTKGKKFYSGAATKEEAEELAADRTAKNPGFTYTVEAK